MPEAIRQSASEPLRIAIAGGSVAGLCAGVALRAIGCDVNIYEQAEGPMRDRGAGIVVQPELIDLLRRHNDNELATTGANRRWYVDPSGRQSREMDMAQRFTSWGAIYATLRDVFPGTRYHSGVRIDRFDTRGRLDLPAAVNGDSTQADLLLFADGLGSAARQQLLPELAPHYAGYVAWRGTVAEQALPDGLRETFHDRFSFCKLPEGGQILCYFIPDADANGQFTRRRLNWVWYVTVPEGEALDTMLTDRDGHRHAFSLPPGATPDALAEQMKARAGERLHPAFAELVQATDEPFLQTIVDLAAPQMVFDRACLIGDAACAVRPHTAAASAKAAADATALAHVLAHALNQNELDIEQALARWQDERLPASHRLFRHGVAMGDKLQFG